MVEVGQGLFGRVQFPDGSMPSYGRPYIVISVDEENVGVLNVSSVAGKEHKLVFSTNKRLVKFNPPFLKASFVKLDSLTYISHDTAASLRVLDGGKKLDSRELQAITDAMKRLDKK